MLFLFYHKDVFLAGYKSLLFYCKHMYMSDRISINRPALPDGGILLLKNFNLYFEHNRYNKVLTSTVVLMRVYFTGLIITGSTNITL